MSRDARVLHVDTGREMRGGQWQVLHLAARTGGVLLAPEGSPLLAAARRQRIECQALGWVGLARLCRAARVVHAHDARAHTMTAVLAPDRLVVTRRVAFPVGASLASRWKYARAARYIAISACVRSRLEEAGVDPSKIDVVFDGVPVPEQAAALEGGRALAVASSDPGKCGSLLREASRISGVPIHFSSELQRDLAGASVFLHASLQEGLGSAALLAMAAGVPVIASRVGGLPEIVAGGETGWLVDNTPEAFAAALRCCLADPQAARELGARARRRVMERFSVDAMVSGTMAVYERLLLP